MNTLLHAVCSLVIYLAWWDKPYDIDEPVLIDTSTDLASKVCAWVIMDSKWGVDRKAIDSVTRELQGVHSLLFDDDLRPSFPSDKEKWELSLEAALEHNKSQGRAEHVHSNDDSIQALMVAQTPSRFLKLYPGQTIHDFRLLLSSDNCQNAYTRLTLGDIECLLLAEDLRKQSNAPRYCQPWKPVCVYQGAEFAEGMLTTHASDTSSPDTYFGYFTGSTRFTRQFPAAANYVFCADWLVAGSVYGAIHLVVWNGPFST